MGAPNGHNGYNYNEYYHHAPAPNGYHQNLPPPPMFNEGPNTWNPISMENGYNHNNGNVQDNDIPPPPALEPLEMNGNMEKNGNVQNVQNVGCDEEKVIETKGNQEKVMDDMKNKEVVIKEKEKEKEQKVEEEEECINDHDDDEITEDEEEEDILPDLTIPCTSPSPMGKKEDLSESISSE